MTSTFTEALRKDLQSLKDEGLFKAERVITSPQGSEIAIQGGREVINLCANNYLGLANHPALVAAAHEALDRYGYGMASVRFICGTQTVHKELEHRVSDFLGTEDTILYSSCFDANGGLFETLLGPEDAVISDALNHASIIDGIRLCKAKRFRYKNNDMEDLEAQLKAARAVFLYRDLEYLGSFLATSEIAVAAVLSPGLAPLFLRKYQSPPSSNIAVCTTAGRTCHWPYRSLRSLIPYFSPMVVSGRGTVAPPTSIHGPPIVPMIAMLFFLQTSCWMLLVRSRA